MYKRQQDQPGNDFRPGNSETFGIGLRYEAHPNWIPQVQLNVYHKSPDQGALADTTDTVGTVAYISPGPVSYTHLDVYKRQALR